MSYAKAKPPMKGGKGKCPNCGGRMVAGKCPKCDKKKK